MTLLLQVIVEVVRADRFDVGERIKERSCGGFWSGPREEKALLKQLGVAVAEFLHWVK